MASEKDLKNPPEHKITQQEINAWNRGKGDEVKNMLLKLQKQLSVDQAVKVVKLYAETGDLHFIALKFDADPSDIRKILRAFDVNSIEDAKKQVREGVIAEFDKQNSTESIVDSNEQKQKEKEAQARLEELDSKQQQSPPEEFELDKRLAESRNQAQQKNKQDQLRAILAEGLQSKNRSSSFRIPMSQIREFRAMIPYGVSAIQRRFGGSRGDVISEIQRLSPQTDISMLRP